MFPNDLRINGLTRDKLLSEAVEHERKEGGAYERDYGVIKIVNDYGKYMELRNRPVDWSEKKAQIGIVDDRLNSNLTPQNKSKKRKISEVEESVFDEQSWIGWKPPTLRQARENLEADFERGLMALKNMVKDYSVKDMTNVDDKKLKDIQFYQKTYKSLLLFLGSGADIVLINKVHQWNDELANLVV